MGHVVELPELPDPGERGLPRYSQRPLPSYRYVPGRKPHPTRDPRGHSYLPQSLAQSLAQSQSQRHPPWRPEGWRHLDDWLYGVDLFHRYYFWESHEAWEGLWAVAERESAPSLLLQGLIQVAAACLKLHLGSGDGARSLSTSGLQKLHWVATATPQLLGLDVWTLLPDLSAYFAQRWLDASPRLTLDVPILRLR